MKSTKLILIVAAALTIGALTGCGQPAATTAEAGATTVAAPSPTPTAPADPVVAAQVASGMTPDAYAAAAAAVQLEGMTVPVAEFNAENAAISAANGGKPVVVIGHIMCPIGGGSPGVEAWGIAGALTAPQNQCGYGWQTSREGAIAELEGRAARHGLAPGDYILIFVDWR